MFTFLGHYNRQYFKCYQKEPGRYKWGSNQDLITRLFNDPFSIDGTNSVKNHLKYQCFIMHTWVSIGHGHYMTRIPLCHSRRTLKHSPIIIIINTSKCRKIRPSRLFQSLNFGINPRKNQQISHDIFQIDSINQLIAPWRWINSRFHNRQQRARYCLNHLQFFF